MGVPNQSLIDYQNQLKQINTDNIASYRKTIESANATIAQMNRNIVELNTQIEGLNAQITQTEEGNVFIDETIAILEQQ